MYHKTVSISTSTVLPAAFFAAISAVALVVSFMAASYLYARSTLIPYGVLLALSFILLELLVVVYFFTLSEFGNFLFSKDRSKTAIPATDDAEQVQATLDKVESEKIVLNKEKPELTVIDNIAEANPAPAIIVQEKTTLEESVQVETIREETMDDCSAPEVPAATSHASAERDESITKLLNLSPKEQIEKRERFNEGRKVLMEAYIREVMKPLLDEKDIDALWIEYKNWIENSMHHPISRMWKWKVKVTSRDVRHLTWNIAKRMGMKTEGGYSTVACARFVKTMFPELCIKKDGSVCTDDYLARNLKEPNDNDFIMIDEPDPNSIGFHLGVTEAA
jgi:hypothetical protein